MLITLLVLLQEKIFKANTCTRHFSITRYGDTLRETKMSTSKRFKLYIYYFISEFGKGLFEAFLCYDLWQQNFCDTIPLIELAG